MFRLIATISSVLALCACATTPDLAAWSASSAELAGAISAEQKAITIQLDADISLIEIGETEGWDLKGETQEISSAHWKSVRDAYLSDLDVVNASLEAMTLYADALAQLASKGETGGEAAKSIQKSLGTILESVGAALPVGGAASKLFEELAGAVTKIQAQDSLAKTMTEIDPIVERLESAISDAADKQLDAISALYAVGLVLELERMGQNRHDWFVRRTRDARGAELTQYQRLERLFSDDGDLLRAAAETYLLQVQQQRYEDYAIALTHRTEWFKAHHAAVATIRDAAANWRKTHRAAANYLEECGGLRFLNPGCGAFSTANISLIAHQIATAGAMLTNETSEPGSR